MANTVAGSVPTRGLSVWHLHVLPVPLCFFFLLQLVQGVHCLHHEIAGIGSTIASSS